GGARLRAAGGGAPPGPAEPRPLALAELEKQTGLEARVLRLLALFDVITPEDGRCRFRDLVAAREVARLLGEGSSLVEILRGATSLTRLGATDLAAARLVRLAPGGLGLRLGDTVAELDGQMLLPMGEGEPDLDALFEAAEAAEASGDLATAERLYGRCAATSRDDPTIQYNLANVLRAAGRLPEAELRYRLAIQLDPRFAEAWYNLAHVLADRGRAGEAERCLEQALAGDPEFGDALYNLAQLRFERDDFAGAAEAWERYLAGDRDSPWARRAKAGLALCRQRLRTAAAEPARRPPA
ncbi:MAG: tetratricopeptide repeat protein, partial [Rhodospirillaceae bacterium]|nr:tetratricopeptide repeat protein [Rhodospirillaceae bacterium]